MGLFNIFKRKQNEGHYDSNSREHGRDGESVSEQQQLNEEKRDMIRGIEELAETSVKEVMIPRIDVDFLSCGTPQDELLEKIAEKQFAPYATCEPIELTFEEVRQIVTEIETEEEVK